LRLTASAGSEGFFFRKCKGYDDIEIVAINDLTDAATLAHLLKYDSSPLSLRCRGEVGNGALIVDGKPIKVLAETAPEKTSLEGTSRLIS